MTRRLIRAAVLLFGPFVIAVGLGAPGLAQNKPIVAGAGSTWSQIAVDQWRADVSRFGLRINYQGVGSSAGRSFYVQDQVDFAVSEIPFEPNEVNALRSKGKEWAYLPIVAGGTSFMYNLRNGSGQAITTLRLDSATATGIFTGTIKKWNDPALVALNPGLGLPDQNVIPVVRSDGSGTTAQFTAYMAKIEQERWCAFAQSQKIACTYTSYYPNFSGSVSQSGSDGVANFVHSESTGRGAITYVETGYALQRGRPVSFLRNGSGNFTLPTSKNVSIALKKATLNADQTQNLDGVYVNADSNAYAMSSYSYMIVPTKGLDPAKGDVLGRFMIYFACDGQRKADQLGYAPLPENLVQVVFDAVRKVPGAPQPPAMSECNNPTITGEGGTSNATAGALSGGQSTSGTAPASAAPTTTAGSGGGAAAAGGPAATAQAAAGAGGNSASGAASNGSENFDSTGAGGADGGTYGGASGTVPLQALEEIQGGATSADSSGPLLASGLVVLFVVFAPPMLSSLRTQREGNIGGFDGR